VTLIPCLLQCTSICFLTSRLFVGGDLHCKLTSSALPISSILLFPKQPGGVRPLTCCFFPFGHIKVEVHFNAKLFSADGWTLLLFYPFSGSRCMVFVYRVLCHKRHIRSGLTPAAGSVAITTLDSWHCAWRAPSSDERPRVLIWTSSCLEGKYSHQYCYSAFNQLLKWISGHAWGDWRSS